MDDEELRLGSLSSYFEQGETEDATEGIRLISIDPNASSMVFKNGFTERVNLQNWKLYSKKNRKEYDFPNIDIEPGQSFTVYIGKSVDPNTSKTKKITFGVTDVFAASNDTA
uniref:Phosphoglucomutase, cytoplasmic n=1 Tax=Lygus hesperus TaxID=30085 RepID=A0A0A9VZI7_LYGHE